MAISTYYLLPQNLTNEATVGYPNHGGQCNFLFLDGGVEAIKKDEVYEKVYMKKVSRYGWSLVPNQQIQELLCNSLFIKIGFWSYIYANTQDYGKKEGLYRVGYRRTACS